MGAHTRRALQNTGKGFKDVVVWIFHAQVLIPCVPEMLGREIASKNRRNSRVDRRKHEVVELSTITFRADLNLSSMLFQSQNLPR